MAVSFFFFFPGHLLDFHSIGGRSEKRWMRAYRRAISTNKVKKARHQIIAYVLFVPQLLPFISLCSIKSFLYFIAIFCFSPFARFLHYKVVWSQCGSGSVQHLHPTVSYLSCLDEEQSFCSGTTCFPEPLTQYGRRRGEAL